MVLRGWEKREGAVIAEKWGEWLQGPLRGREPVHIVFSPPQRPAHIAVQTDRGYRELREELRVVADWIGVQTACAIFHPVRMGVTAGAAYGCRDGPHWHLIAVAFARGRDAWVDGRKVAALSAQGSLEDPLNLEDATHPLVGSGWVVKNLGPRRSIMATAAYLLSHAGVASISASAATFGGPSPVQSVTWWGWKADWPVPSPVPAELATRWCPLCREEVPLEKWFELEIVDPPDPPPPGTGLVLLEDRVTPKLGLKQEWEKWREDRERWAMDADYSGEDAVHPRPPPGV